MKEKLSLNQEVLDAQPEAAPRTHENKQNTLKNHESSTPKAEKASAEDMHRLAKKVEASAKSKQEMNNTLDELHNDQDSQKAYGHITQRPSVSQTITQVRRHLKPAERKFSKVVHNPAVEAVSDITGATIARPSGLLYGALFSLIASVGLLLIAKRYGYEYNAFIGILAFVGGFGVGLLIEALTRLFRLTKRS